MEYLLTLLAMFGILVGAIFLDEHILDQRVNECAAAGGVLMRDAGGDATLCVKAPVTIIPRSS